MADNLICSFTLPHLPASMNQIYSIVPIWSARKISVQLKDDILYWKTQSKEYIPAVEVEAGRKLWMSLALHGKWMTSKGTIRVIDLQNLLKVIIDTIADKLKFNDSRIFELKKIKKIESDDDKIEVELGYLDE